MKTRVLMGVLLLGAAAACGNSTYGGSTGTTGSTGSSGTTGTNGLTVTMGNFKFQPATMTIQAGQTVTWKNTDTIDHTVTSGTPSAPTGLFDMTLHPNDTFQFTFQQAGAFQYFCRFHASMGMTGTVQVGSGSSTGSAGTTGTTTTGGSTTGTSATSGY